MKKAKLGLNNQKEIATGLSALLADSYMLYIKTHNFHWNVEGPMFNTLHIMFMEQYTELWNALDLIAERIRALGEYAPGSYKQFASLTSITESEKVPKAMKMIEELLKGHEIVIQTARKLFPLAGDQNDEVTCDLLTQRLQVHEKTAWMLRSLLSEK
jgi:starvation-inducible DNA-binding protein